MLINTLDLCNYYICTVDTSETLAYINNCYFCNHRHLVLGEDVVRHEDWIPGKGVVDTSIFLYFDYYTHTHPRMHTHTHILESKCPDILASGM